MPTYEYRCEACGHEFEAFQSMTAAPLETCPACEKDQLRRLIGTGAGIIFKGSGFYETDYRSKDYKEKAKAEQQGTRDDQSSGESGGSSSGGDGGAGSSDTSGKSAESGKAGESQGASSGQSSGGSGEKKGATGDS